MSDTGPRLKNRDLPARKEETFCTWRTPQHLADRFATYSLCRRPMRRRHICPRGKPGMLWPRCLRWLMLLAGTLGKLTNWLHRQSRNTFQMYTACKTLSPCRSRSPTRTLNRLLSQSKAHSTQDDSRHILTNWLHRQSRNTFQMYTSCKTLSPRRSRSPSRTSCKLLSQSKAHSIQDDSLRIATSWLKLAPCYIFLPRIQRKTHRPMSCTNQRNKSRARALMLDSVLAQPRAQLSLAVMLDSVLAQPRAQLSLAVMLDSVLAQPRAQLSLAVMLDAVSACLEHMTELR